MKERRDIIHLESSSNISLPLFYVIIEFPLSVTLVLLTLDVLDLSFEFE